jgi:hypothetical protein
LPPFTTLATSTALTLQGPIMQPATSPSCSAHKDMSDTVASEAPSWNTKRQRSFMLLYASSSACTKMYAIDLPKHRCQGGAYRHKINYDNSCFVT